MFDDIVEIVGDVPHLLPSRARMLYDFLVEHDLGDMLELGFAHGTSTCYLAAAAEALDGHVTTMDRPEVMQRDPDIATLLDAVGLTSRVDVVLAHTYLWPMRALLRDQLARGDDGTFDFVFLDGAHIWEVDGPAFLLADRLLRPGGWILFDDLDWSIDTSPTMRTSERYVDMPEEFRTACQVGDVFELLVATHGGYAQLSTHNGWGWARKSPTGISRLALPELRREAGTLARGVRRVAGRA